MSMTNRETAMTRGGRRPKDSRNASLGRILLWLFVSVFAVGGAGCQTVQVAADWDPAFDFTRLGSWRFAKTPLVSTGNELLDTNTLFKSRVQSAIAADLTERGYVKRGDEGEVDFEVAYFFTVEDKTKVTQINDYYGYGPGYGYGWRGGYGGGSQTVVDQYQQGMLIIDINKPGEKHQLLWRGTGSARVNQKQNSPEEAAKKINAAVKAILARFPPAPKQN